MFDRVLNNLIILTLFLEHCILHIFIMNKEEMAAPNYWMEVDWTKIGYKKAYKIENNAVVLKTNFNKHIFEKFKKLIYY